MNYIFFLMTMVFLRLLSLFPRHVIYFFSDILSFILLYIAQYRKKVTTTNLKKAFPDYSDMEIINIRRKFYKHLADLILENAVVQFYSEKRLKKMYILDQPEVYEKYYLQGRHIIILAGHFNNWEWAPTMSYTTKYQVLAVYKPLHNKHFDLALRKSRTRFGAIATPMGKILRTMFELDHKGIPALTGMIADQRPGKKKIDYWTHFLNQKTAFFNGAEKLAKKFNAVVVLMDVQKVKRGLYKGNTILITDNPRQMKENQITELFARQLENMIVKNPQYWLWSHKRWNISYEEWQNYKKNKENLRMNLF